MDQATDVANVNNDDDDKTGFMTTHIRYDDDETVIDRRRMCKVEK